MTDERSVESTEGSGFPLKNPEDQDKKKQILSFKPPDENPVTLRVSAEPLTEPDAQTQEDVQTKPQLTTDKGPERKTAKKPRRVSKKKSPAVIDHNVFFEDTFYDQFIEDLRNATGLVVIHCPYIYSYRLNLLLPELKRCIKRGVRVCIFLEEPDKQWKGYEEKKEHVDNMAQVLLVVQIHVTLRLNIHEKLAIIDDKIFWEGSLNSLSQSKTFERSTRWVNPQKVQEAIESHGLLDCRMCYDIAQGSGLSAGTAIFGRQIIGRAIKKRREELGISRTDLAASAKISRQTLLNIETGKGDPYLSTIENICVFLEVEIRLVVWFLLPGLDQKMIKRKEPLVLRIQKARRSPWIKDS